MRHFTSKILMISPNKFRNNEYTHSDNVFQSKKTNENDVQSEALKEFNRLRDIISCLLYTSPSPRDFEASRMPSSA